MVQCQLPDLGVEDREIWRVRCRLRAAKHVGGPRQQVLFPFRDLGGMHAKLSRQLRLGFVALERGEGHLGLESWCVIPSHPFHALAPLVRHPSGVLVEQGYHLTHCPNFRGPLSRMCRSATYPP